MEISILGMHRSGTSMVSRLLNLCGVDLGSEDNLMGANPDDNAAGYWEHESVVAINDAILEQLGGLWDHVPSVKPGWSKDEIFDPIRERITDVIRSFDYASVWGWKDPRTTITLELWRDMLPDLKLIVCIRHPMEVALSLSRANVKTRVMPYDEGLKLWSALATRPGVYRLFTGWGVRALMKKVVELLPSPVDEYASRHGIPVYTPKSLKQPDAQT